jgi:hypothetical protein
MFTSDEGRALISGLEETSSALLAEFAGLDEEDAGAAPEADPSLAREGEGWSVKQLIAHVSEIERDLIEEALQIAGGPGVTVGHPLGALWGEAQRDANDRPFDEIVEESKTVHAWTLEQLESLTDADLEIDGTHRGSGPTTVLSALSIVVGHRRSHIFQARSNLVSLRGHREGRSPEEAYSVTGDGVPTVLLIDAAASRWDAVAAALSANGYGVVQYHFGPQTSDIDRLRGELSIDELWIGGSGFGAVDACKYVIAHPDRVNGLVMANMPILPFYRDRPDDFSAVTVPTLTLVGENYVQVERARERATEFADGTVLVIDDSGRDLPGEQPDAVAAAIGDFVPARS